MRKLMKSCVFCDCGNKLQPATLYWFIATLKHRVQAHRAGSVSNYNTSLPGMLFLNEPLKSFHKKLCSTLLFVTGWWCWKDSLGFSHACCLHLEARSCLLPASWGQELGTFFLLLRACHFSDHKMFWSGEMFRYKMSDCVLTGWMIMKNHVTSQNLNFFISKMGVVEKIKEESNYSAFTN